MESFPLKHLFHCQHLLERNATVPVQASQVFIDCARFHGSVLPSYGTRLRVRLDSPRIHWGFRSRWNCVLAALTMVETASSGESVITHRAVSSELIVRDLYTKGYSDQNHFAQHFTFAHKGRHDSIVEISEKHCGFGASRSGSALREGARGTLAASFLIMWGLLPHCFVIPCQRTPLTL